MTGSPALTWVRLFGAGAAQRPRQSSTAPHVCPGLGSDGLWAARPRPCVPPCSRLTVSAGAAHRRGGQSPDRYRVTPWPQHRGQPSVTCRDTSAVVAATARPQPEHRYTHGVSPDPGAPSGGGDTTPRRGRLRVEDGQGEPIGLSVARASNRARNPTISSKLTAAGTGRPGSGRLRSSATNVFPSGAAGPALDYVQGRLDGGGREGPAATRAPATPTGRRRVANPDRPSVGPRSARSEHGSPIQAADPRPHRTDPQPAGAAVRHG